MKVVEPPADEVMDYRGLSGHVKLAEGTLRKMVMRGEIPLFKIRSSVRFSKKHVDAWLEEHNREPKRTEKKGGAE